MYFVIGLLFSSPSASTIVPCFDNVLLNPKRSSASAFSSLGIQMFGPSSPPLFSHKPAAPGAVLNILPQNPLRSPRIWSSLLSVRETKNSEAGSSGKSPNCTIRLDWLKVGSSISIVKIAFIPSHGVVPPTPAFDVPEFSYLTSASRNGVDCALSFCEDIIPVRMIIRAPSFLPGSVPLDFSAVLGLVPSTARVQWSW